MKKTIPVLLLFICSQSFSQDRAFARKIVDTLTSPWFWGRGYTEGGMQKAADFLADQMKSYGLQPLKGRSYLQSFSYPVNTFPGIMEVAINDKYLVPGRDFIVAPESKSVKTAETLQAVDSVTYINRLRNIVVQLTDKLTWSVSNKEAPYTMLLVDKKAISQLPATLKVNIDNKFIRDFKTANVCGMVKGTIKPDSVILITAHYDHLGGMGAGTYFPGANDNASGISLLLNLAHYYSTHPQPYTMAFICFAGEEAGLLGSEYFTENPLIPLKSIRFLINTDLAGTGEDGITVVNATEFPKEFVWLNEVNKANNLLVKINARGKAQNSDHYYFTEKGVPAFFFYTLGGISAYHDIFDKGETLPLNEHEDLFKLVVGFNDKLMGK